MHAFLVIASLLLLVLTLGVKSAFVRPMMSASSPVVLVFGTSSDVQQSDNRGAMFNLLNTPSAQASFVSTLALSATNAGTAHAPPPDPGVPLERHRA